KARKRAPRWRSPPGTSRLRRRTACGGGGAGPLRQPGTPILRHLPAYRHGGRGVVGAPGGKGTPQRGTPPAPGGTGGAGAGGRTRAVAKAVGTAYHPGHTARESETICGLVPSAWRAGGSAGAKAAQCAARWKGRGGYRARRDSSEGLLLFETTPSLL